MNNKMTQVEDAWQLYQKGLLRFIRSKVSTTYDAEDILNDVFLKLSNSANQDNIPENISAWLYRVTKNSLVDYYRKKKSYKLLPEDLTEKVEDSDAINQLSNCMLPMILALPESYQLPLRLSEIEGMKYKEVAAEMKLTIPAVKSRILRGRQKLHKSILSCCTINQNGAGEVIDFELKSKDFCGSC